MSRPWLAKASLVGLAAIGALAAATRPPARPSWILPSAVAGAAGLIAYTWLQGRAERTPAVPRAPDREGGRPHAFDRRTFVRGIVTDRRSPIAYGYDAQVPVYFSQSPVLNAGGGGFGGGRGGEGGIPGVGMDTTPMANQQTNKLSIYDPEGGSAPAVMPQGRGAAPGGA